MCTCIINIELLPETAKIILATAAAGQITYDHKHEENARETITIKNTTIKQLKHTIKKLNITELNISSITF